ncbi:MAG TPA: rhodanese-like domain-containing protein [bacterium]|nr:rhodanese-like domain-containing protein [bacterium]
MKQSLAKILLFLAVVFLVDQPRAEAAETISPKKLAQMLQEGEQLQLLDVRELSEIQRAGFPGARHIPMGQLEARIAELNPDQTTVVICHYGNRSSVAAEQLKKKGFKNVMNLKGGIDAYSREVDPGIPRY